MRLSSGRAVEQRGGGGGRDEIRPRGRRLRRGSMAAAAAAAERRFRIDDEDGGGGAFRLQKFRLYETRSVCEHEHLPGKFSFFFFGRVASVCQLCHFGCYCVCFSWMNRVRVFGFSRSVLGVLLSGAVRFFFFPAPFGRDLSFFFLFFFLLIAIC